MSATESDIQIVLDGLAQCGPCEHIGKAVKIIEEYRYLRRKVMSLVWEVSSIKEGPECSEEQAYGIEDEVRDFVEGVESM